MSELTKEHFDNSIKNFVTKVDFEAGLIDVVTKKDFEGGLVDVVSKQEFQAGIGNLATKNDLKEGLEELAIMVNKGFIDIQERLDVTEKVQSLETDVSKIKGVLKLT